MSRSAAAPRPLRPIVTAARLPSTPSRPIAASDRVVLIGDPKCTGVVERVLETGDADVAWAAGVNGRVPISFLLLAGEVA